MHFISRLAHVIQGSRGKVIINKKSFSVTLRAWSITMCGHQHGLWSLWLCNKHQDRRGRGECECVSRNVLCFCCLQFTDILYQTQQDVSDYLRWASKPFLVHSFDSILSLLTNSAWCCFLPDWVLSVWHISPVPRPGDPGVPWGYSTGHVLHCTGHCTHLCPLCPIFHVLAV